MLCIITLREIMRINTFRRYYDIINTTKTPSDYPIIIDLELTNKCNFRCTFCSRNTMSRDQGFMSERILSRILVETKQRKTPLRFIRMGEPFLHPDILSYAKKVKANGNPLHITTNGSLLNKQISQELVDLELDSIIFSMQGATKEEYESIRTNGKYDVLRKNINDLYEIRESKDKPYIQITTTLDKRDTEKENEFIKTWNNSCDKIQIGITNYARINDTMEGVYKPCSEVLTKLSVDYDGTITACCIDHDRLMSLGNINHNSLKEAWNCDTLKSIRQLLKEEKFRYLTLCKSCFRAYNF